MTTKEEKKNANETTIGNTELPLGSGDLLGVVAHDNKKNGNNTINMLTGGVFVMGATVLGLVGVQFPFLRTKQAPFMATPHLKIRQALQFINKTDASSGLPPTKSKWRSRPPVFVDLGSGDGQAVYEAAKLGYWLSCYRY